MREGRAAQLASRPTHTLFRLRGQFDLLNFILVTIKIIFLYTHVFRLPRTDKRTGRGKGLGELEYALSTKMVLVA